jgi:hypothetical protein
MAAGYSQWPCFIPGAKIGPVPVYDTFLEKDLQALLDRVGRGRGKGGGLYRTLKETKNAMNKESQNRIEQSNIHTQSSMFFGQFKGHSLCGQRAPRY